MPEEILEEQEEQEEQEKTTDVEELASELGWRPKDDFEGEDFVTAEDYIRKSRDIQNTMRDHIKDQKNQLTGLVKSVDDLKLHNELVFKAENKRLQAELTDLKKEKKEAIEEGDVAKVDELDEQIGDVQGAIKEEPKQSSSNPEFDAWVTKNPWFETDPEMAQYANAIAEQNQGAPFSRISALATKKVKEMFPDKFEETKPKKASPVESATRKSASQAFTKSDLTTDQQQIMQQFVKQGIMTEKQYIADIAKTQGA